MQHQEDSSNINLENDTDHSNVASEESAVDEKMEIALKEVEEMFDLFDKNKDGTIDLSELKSVFTALGQEPTPEELVGLLNTNGSENPEAITKLQFIAMIKTFMNSALQRDELAEAFAFFDKNGDGHISKAELKMVLLQLGENLGEEEIEEIFKEADLNNDGIIDYHEFITIFNK